MSYADATLYEALSLPVRVARCTKPVVTVPEGDGDGDEDDDDGDGARDDGDEDGDGDGDEDGDGAWDDDEPLDGEAPAWPVTECPLGIVTAGTVTAAWLPTAGSAVFGAGAALPLMPPAPLARVADADTECVRPAADPICCIGPFAYPNIRTAGLPAATAGAASTTGVRVNANSTHVVSNAAIDENPRAPVRRLR